MKYIILALCIAGGLSIVGLTACQSSAAEQETGGKPARPLQENLPGTWESVSVQVVVNSAEGDTTESYVFEVPEEEWARRLGMKPIRSFFFPNNTYRQEFMTVNDSMINVARGIWNAFGDTLMLIEPDATYQYVVKFDKGMMELRALLDWDGDGLEDDDYLGIHRRVSMTAE
jgi:hypothetical protein